MRQVELPVTCLAIWNDKLFTGVGNQILIRDLNSLKLLGSSSDFKNNKTGVKAILIHKKSNIAPNHILGRNGVGWLHLAQRDQKYLEN